MANNERRETLEEIYTGVTVELARTKRRLSIKNLLLLIVCLVVIMVWIISLFGRDIRKTYFFTIKVSEWLTFLVAIVFSRLVVQGISSLVIFFLESNFLLKRNVVFYSHNLKNNISIIVWMSLVLAIFKYILDLRTPPSVEKFLHLIFKAIAYLLTGSVFTLVKTILVTKLMISFQLETFFDRIQETIFNQYTLQILSKNPLVESGQVLANREENKNVNFMVFRQNSWVRKTISWVNVRKMKMKQTPLWTIKLLISLVLESSLSTISDALEKVVVEGEVEQEDHEITSKEKAMIVASRIFANLIRDKPDQSYVDRSDLQRFMTEEEVDFIYLYFEANEKGEINLNVFSNWMLKVYKDRLDLQNALKGNDNALKQFNLLFMALLVFPLTTIIWLLVIGLEPSETFLLFFSPLVIIGVFGNTGKILFESVTFIFITHPFDVGDRCTIDDKMMVVEKMSIFTTIFRREDEEKVWVPNTILATKNIGNYHRSPNQGDMVYFSIEDPYTFSKLEELKSCIRECLEHNLHFWYPEHDVVVEGVEDKGHKIKMALFFTHRLNLQGREEKKRRREKLILKLHQIFQELRFQKWDILQKAPSADKQ